ncbi:FadR family transcriptional regulator [Alkalihalobacillus oceani]|uniref:FadR/GntR family transcriptional regulator n=1 Tax=Halalkalibacter oceani TaxID=1653776 RepID=UPI00203C8EB2|nr:FadR/GntR family transcriptional regulator [Halalkalibacter oceani]MCM3762290.1 FadR family transcriptional regulator [Halalkalibacter oceani]
MYELKKIKKKRIYEEVIVEINNLIKRGVLKIGDKLPSEAELSKSLSVSKATVREAMSVLKSNGLIEVKPGIGTFLTEAEGSNAITPVVSMLLLNEFPLIEVFELRRALEVEAVSLSVERAVEDDIKRLIKTNQAMSDAISRGETALAEDFEFHRLIFESTHNSVFIKVFNSISTLIKEGLAASKQRNKKNPMRNVEGLEEHWNIINAIEKRDAIGARRAMRIHLYNNETRTWEVKNSPTLDRD